MDAERTLALCVARLTGAPPDEVPTAAGPLREWLATRGLGLVPVAGAGEFEWPGHFLGRQRETGGWAVIFGVPPGVVWDPLDPAAAGPADLDAAFVLATHELRPAEARTPEAAGRVELIAVAPAREAPMRTVHGAVAVAGRGLEGDRYAAGDGTFTDPGGTGHDLTLIEAEALEELAAAGIALEPADARRNIACAASHSMGWSDADSGSGRRSASGSAGASRARTSSG